MTTRSRAIALRYWRGRMLGFSRIASWAVTAMYAAMQRHEQLRLEDLAARVAGLMPPRRLRFGAVLGLEVPARPIYGVAWMDGRKLAAVIFCDWCQRDTPHLRQPDQTTFACVNRESHTHTFAYRTLAASYSEAARYPGCICAPGECTVVGGPDPSCEGLAHRP